MAKRLTVTEMNLLQDIIMDQLKDSIKESFHKQYEPFTAELRAKAERWVEIRKQIEALMKEGQDIYSTIPGEYSEEYSECFFTRWSNGDELGYIGQNDRLLNKFTDKVRNKTKQALLLSNLDSSVDIEAIVNKIKGELL